MIATSEDDVTAKLFEITNGKGVNVVFDPVGRKRRQKSSMQWHKMVVTSFMER